MVGSNGSGKSTLIDAISYVLFGKAHRKINKAQLINSINKKDMLVEIEFLVGDVQYKVSRGQKPNRFEILKDGEILNQSSHAKKYQRILEQNILQHNHKTFHQVEVLGSSNFTPFMQLPAWSRREVVEDILDINLFSRMNTILKERISKHKADTEYNDHQIELVDTKMMSQRSHINDLKKVTAEFVEGKREEIQTTQQQIDELNEELRQINTNSVDGLKTDLANTTKKIRDIMAYISQFERKIKDLNSEIAFYEDNDHCNTCDQSIDEQFKETKIAASKEKICTYESARVGAEKESAKFSETEQKIQEQLNKELAVFAKIESIQSNINSKQSRVSILQGELQELEETESISNAITVFENYVSQKSELADIKLDLLEQKEYLNIGSELLKDTGIKTKIIKQYLPAMNQILNNYLQTLDFYVSFELDEGFNETIRSRHRDDFSYDSFSEGEKQRIDLALLFTWREIAKRKNSVSTNMLILDETFDASLDADGVENLFKILDTIDDSVSIFVISHQRELLRDKFERTITFEKKKGFSTHTEN
jgi:DNA repair exonuclease SbcCD ATPase subunit